MPEAETGYPLPFNVCGALHPELLGVLERWVNFPVPLITAKHKENYKDYGVDHDDRDGILANYNVARPRGREVDVLPFPSVPQKLQSIRMQGRNCCFRSARSCEVQIMLL
jgi:hypothetical protein